MICFEFRLSSSPEEALIDKINDDILLQIFSFLELKERIIIERGKWKETYKTRLLFNRTQQVKDDSIWNNWYCFYQWLSDSWWTWHKSQMQLSARFSCIFTTKNVPRFANYVKIADKQLMLSHFERKFFHLNLIANIVSLDMECYIK